MTSPNTRSLAVVVVAPLAVGCSESPTPPADPETGGSFASEGGVDGSTGPHRGVEVSVGQLPPLCATAPLRNLPGFGDAQRFTYQRVLDVGPPTPLVLDVPDGDSVSVWIPFEATDGDGPVPTSSGLGALTSILGVVPSTVFASEARDGYDMLRYESDPGSAESEQRLSIEIAVVEAAEALALDGSSVAELDAGRALLLHGGGADGGVVRYALCDAELAADVHRFDLDAGTIAFHTRPAIWGINSGFTVLAEGVVSGKTLSVDSYWDLGYASGDMGTGGLYGVMPSLFVRAEDDGDGRCALVVEANPMDNGQSFVARWLGCDGSTTEVLTVLGSQFEPKAGTSAPMRR